MYYVRLFHLFFTADNIYLYSFALSLRKIRAYRERKIRLTLDGCVTSPDGDPYILLYNSVHTFARLLDV